MSDATSILLIDGNTKDRQHYAHRLQVSSPDYVIFELGLPDMSGFDVLAKLLPVARRPEIPVIVLTKYSNEALWHVATMNGAFCTLQKSTTSGDHLHEVVSKALATIPRDRKKDR